MQRSRRLRGRRKSSSHPVCDATPGEVVGGELDADGVTGKDRDEGLAQLPEMWASTSCPFSRRTLNIAFGRGRTTSPSTSMASFFGRRTRTPRLQANECNQSGLSTRKGRRTATSGTEYDKALSQYNRRSWALSEDLGTRLRDRDRVLRSARPGPRAAPHGVSCRPPRTRHRRRGRTSARWRSTCPPRCAARSRDGRSWHLGVLVHGGWPMPCPTKGTADPVAVLVCHRLDGVRPMSPRRCPEQQQASSSPAGGLDQLGHHRRHRDRWSRSGRSRRASRPGCSRCRCSPDHVRQAARWRRDAVHDLVVDSAQSIPRVLPYPLNDGMAPASRIIRSAMASRSPVVTPGRSSARSTCRQDPPRAAHAVVDAFRVTAPVSSRCADGREDRLSDRLNRLHAVEPLDDADPRSSWSTTSSIGATVFSSRARPRADRRRAA